AWVAGHNVSRPSSPPLQAGEEGVPQPVRLDNQVVVLDRADVAGDEQHVAGGNPGQVAVQVARQDHSHPPPPGAAVAAGYKPADFGVSESAGYKPAATALG